ncbi:MAG: 2-C-methyl-D-erythritol 4-phosphate cytidylyltransferase [Phycisphaerales bacterium]|nr:MAG: 2-C-methyl-D-erythritol 4-phosphate cytidylyltransferase [Phycisphaerales bacterium]
MAKFAVIIPAAGESQRFGGSEKKPFARLDGRPVFLHTVERFINREDVCQTILVIAPSDLETVRTKYGPNLAFMGVTLAEGGRRRCDSVASALKQLKDEAEFVAVHDAARPCVTEAMIDAVFAEAVKAGAAILASPITATLKRVAASGTIDATVSRENLFEAQTPQVFRRDVLLSAYADLAGGSDDVTDDAELVQRSGVPVAVVQSDLTNLKITTKADVALAHAILKARPARAVSKLGAFEEAQW